MLFIIKKKAFGPTVVVVVVVTNITEQSQQRRDSEQQKRKRNDKIIEHIITQSLNIITSEHIIKHHLARHGIQNHYKIITKSSKVIEESLNIIHHEPYNVIVIRYCMTLWYDQIWVHPTIVGKAILPIFRHKRYNRSISKIDLLYSLNAISWIFWYTTNQK